MIMGSVPLIIFLINGAPMVTRRRANGLLSIFSYCGFDSN